MAGIGLGLLILAYMGASQSQAFDPGTIADRGYLEALWREYPRVEFSTLSGFPYGDPFGSAVTLQGAPYVVPGHIRDLSGRKVSVVGFMLPLDVNEHGVTEFLLNASFDMCYLGAPTLPNQFVVVKMRNRRRTRYTHTPVAVFGTLHVREERRNGRVVSLYEMEADQIGM